MAFDTTQPAQVSGLNGYTVDPLITIGDEINGYTAPGVPDGLGAIAIDENTIRLFVNHEIASDEEVYSYSLANGTELTGARVSYFDIDKTTRTVVNAGLAYDTIYNRAGDSVDDASDLEFGGLNRLCSAQLIPANQFGEGMGIVDNIFFTGEETGGGTEYALDVATGELWAVPAMGVAAWESVTEIDTGSTDKVAFLVGDDRAPAPMTLYVGEKNALGDGSFLDRNGLAQGQLYVWVSDEGDADPSTFRGTGSSRSGKFVAVDYYRPDLASDDGSSGYDALGYATQTQQDLLATDAGAFLFSRPEDLATNPNDGTMAVLNSTGRDSLFGGVDSWGTTYTFDLDFGGSDITATVKAIYDSDDAGGGQFAGPDFGIRSQDNLDWADDGYIYVQEDRALSDFGQTSGEEASLWRLDPNTSEAVRVGQVNRTTGIPDGQTDGAIGDIGNWETSGIIDVSTLFGEDPGELFLFDVQAHSVEDGIIADAGLVQGGQIAFLSGPAELTGFASLPADTFAEGPPTGAGIEGNGRTGPFEGPPVQGFSGVQFAPGGDGSTYWFLSDNGFGAQGNSADYLLRIYQVDPSLAGSEGGDGSVEVQGFVQLSDPDNLVPFDIVNEGTADRLLTGADFDVESFVIGDNGDIWIGEEFGPYILHFDASGKLLEAPVATPNINTLNTLNGQDPLVIGHRGAAGRRPEHTLAAYEFGIENGADFIEPDLVVTKDGVLIARHEPDISGTTDVADHPEFADRKTTKMVDGAPVTGWFAEDFTLAEIKTLRAKERLDFRDHSYDGLYEIPTLDEIIDLVKQTEADTGKKIGIYPETKHPTYFEDKGFNTSQLLIDDLVKNDFTDPSRVFIQSFEVSNLKDLHDSIMPAAGVDIPLVQLLDAYDVADDGTLLYQDVNARPYDFVVSGDTRTYGDLQTSEGLAEIATYADGIGPWKRMIVSVKTVDEDGDGNPDDLNGDGTINDADKVTLPASSLIEDAHAAGLQVHPYTFRNEERYLASDYQGDPNKEYEQFISLGVDAYFTDFPDTGDFVRDQITDDTVRSPQNPDVLAGEAVSNLPNSKGFEGMAFSPDRTTLYPLLEGTVVGDPAGSLRIYEFDTKTSSFEGLVGLYQMEAADHAIGDFTPINNHEFLVIERDNGQGETAEFKKIFKVDFSDVDSNGFIGKEEAVDLLTLDDPNDLNGDGKTTFDFPFVTIEDVLVLDKDTILVANDNNYPFSVGRGPDIDNNEIIEVKLNKSLDLDPRLGVEGSDRYGFAGSEFDTAEAPMMTGLNGYTVDPLFTTGETYGGYTPPGVFDGLGAFALDDNTIRVLANHELASTAGYAYQLANGTELTGGRVSYFDIDKDSLAVVDAGLAYDTIYNRAGEIVDEAADLEFGGLNRLCSAQLIPANQFGAGMGIVDNIFFTGEETSGGTEYALDVATGELWAVPALGFAAWESVTEIDTGSADKVAFLIGDDRAPAPMTLYVGEKNALGDGSFLDRNGLAQGQLYVWVSDSGDGDPTDFRGTGSSRDGQFVAIDYYRPDLASDDGSSGYDALGYATQAQQDVLATDAGAFLFSRPEDLATNPNDGTMAVLNSTGRDSLFGGVDSWGTTYTFDLDFGGSDITATVKAIYDSDDAGGGQFEGPDFGIRSQDNLDWADDDYIYVQEDRAIEPDFGATSGEEASIWRLDPNTSEAVRVGQIDRSAVPSNLSDPEPADIGNWESSGIIDVSDLFGRDGGSLFLFDVQAHSLRDGVVADEGLVEGSQLAFLSKDEPVQGLVNLTGFDGDVAVNVTASRDATYDNILKFYQTDAKGAVDGLLPGEAGYEAAVAGNLIDGAGLSLDNFSVVNGSMIMAGGSYYAPALLVQGSTENLVTIHDAALGQSHIQTNGNVWRFEDLTDNDFNDLIVTIDSVEPVVA
ncbi:esterase-like activity of phytase family protein [Nodosilinea nodulosa]|uniref:esterase-like activity of phytase family protein n=1 Tax=Nodosilinea nodulosa TaxID=416001 RepID=UPI0002FE2DAD